MQCKISIVLDSFYIISKSQFFYNTPSSFNNMEKQDQSNNNQGQNDKRNQNSHIVNLAYQYQSPSSIIQIDQKWIHPDCTSTLINFDLLVCPVCYGIPLSTKVQCVKCQRIFCEQDYSNIKAKKNQCPICKISPWKVKDQVHILYKSVFDKVIFSCNICNDNKALKCEELVKHLAIDHKKKIQKFPDICDFEIVFPNKDIIRLDKYQCLQANHQILNKKSKQFKIQLHDNSTLLINVLKSVAHHSKKGNGQIMSRISKQIISQKVYHLWEIALDTGVKFYNSQIQQKISYNFAQFEDNQKLNEFNFDLGEIRYRISFKYMAQINTASQFSRPIKRVQIKFK